MEKIRQTIDDLEHDIVWELQHGEGTYTEVKSRLDRMEEKIKLLKDKLNEKENKQDGGIPPKLHET